MSAAVARALADQRAADRRGRHRHRQDARVSRARAAVGQARRRVDRHARAAGSDRAPRPAAAAHDDRAAVHRGRAEGRRRTTCAGAGSPSRVARAADVERRRRRARRLWTGEHTETGDRAEVEWLGEDAPLWTEVTTTPDARIGPRCPYFERCFVTQARRARREGAADPRQPPPLLRRSRAARRASRRARAARSRRGDLRRGAPARGRRDRALRRARLDAHARRARPRCARSRSRACRCGPAAPPTTRSTPSSAPASRCSRRCAARWSRRRRHARAAARTACSITPSARHAWFGSTPRSRISRAPPRPRPSRRPTTKQPTTPARARASPASPAARASCATISRRSPSSARRATSTGARRAPTGTTLTASPIDVAELVRRHIVTAGPTPIFTSATLAAAGDVRYTRARLGLDDADELLVASPFDYTRQAMLYVPRDLPPPHARRLHRRRRRAHARAARDHRAAARSCCSRRIARCATPRTRLATLPYPQLVQGDAPRATLVDRFRATPHAVLLGTALVLGRRRRPRRCAQPRRDRQAAVRAAHRSAGRRAHAGARRGRRRSVRDDPAPRRRARAQAGLRPLDPPPRRPRHRRDPRLARSSRSYGRVFLDTLPAGCRARRDRAGAALVGSPARRDLVDAT